VFSAAIAHPFKNGCYSHGILAIDPMVYRRLTPLSPFDVGKRSGGFHESSTQIHLGDLMSIKPHSLVFGTLQAFSRLSKSPKPMLSLI